LVGLALPVKLHPTQGFTAVITGTPAGKTCTPRGSTFAGGFVGLLQMIDGSLLMLGVSGPVLTPDEAALFRRLQPAGYVLFHRNFASPAQTRQLTDDLRSLSATLPILAIDPQGGRATWSSDIRHGAGHPPRHGQNCRCRGPHR
jgi:hypothetical protein